MPRTARMTPGEMVFPVLNRGVGRMPLFGKNRDYETFEEMIKKTLQTRPMRICDYCLSDWPEPRPHDWLALVNRPQTEAELAAIRRSVARGQPCGGDIWVRKTACELGLESTLRARGRPRERE